MKETRAPDNTIKSAKMYLDDIKSKDPNSIKRAMRDKYQCAGTSSGHGNQKT